MANPKSDTPNHTETRFTSDLQNKIWHIQAGVHAVNILMDRIEDKVQSLDAKTSVDTQSAVFLMLDITEKIEAINTDLADIQMQGIKRYMEEKHHD
jgi:hypothetical protein